MIQQMHLAAQYLAAAGMSFVKKEEDDSHTNLGFSTEKTSLYTRKLFGTDTILYLNYTSFSLEWVHKNSREILMLDGKTHVEIVNWIQQISQDNGIDVKYQYNLHYELPYPITDDFTFSLHNNTLLQELLEYRKSAHQIIAGFLENHHLDSEIRIWPHHFDTGAFTILNNTPGISIGLGLAIPDTMCNDFYLYISGYKGHNPIDTKPFAPLSHGEWKNNGFTGAILPMEVIDKKIGISFFSEALKVYRN